MSSYWLRVETLRTDKSLLPNKSQALLGREQAMLLKNKHFVNGRPIQWPYSDPDLPLEQVLFGMGCFWGAERIFWTLDGVYTTAVGYAAGITPNPSYDEVCGGLTGHNEVVLVVFESSKISFLELLKVFFESHNPTQGMRQGNDNGTQYRSGIYCSNSKQVAQAKVVLKEYQRALLTANFDKITTEILSASEFYYAEQYHQQYLAKNPNGYCGIGGTGIRCGVSE